MTETLLLRGVDHRYGEVTAVTGVDLTVAPGECVALLGPNGAGKTTLIGLATGLLVVQRGRVEVCGSDPRLAATRLRLGVVQQEMGFPRTLTVAELVRGAAVRAGRRATAAGPVMAEVGITELAARRAARLSGGQRQLVALAMALVGDPTLLLLDEPTVGLDLTARATFWRTIAARRDAGTGVLLTTHIVEEAAAFADRVDVLRRGDGTGVDGTGVDGTGGRIVASDTPAGLVARLPDRTVTARTSIDVTELRTVAGVVSATATGDRVRVTTVDPENLLRHWLAADAGLADLRVEGAGLEQALLALTTNEEMAA